MVEAPTFSGWGDRRGPPSNGKGNVYLSLKNRRISLLRDLSMKRRKSAHFLRDRGGKKRMNNSSASSAREKKNFSSGSGRGGSRDRRGGIISLASRARSVCKLLTRLGEGTFFPGNVSTAREERGASADAGRGEGKGSITSEKGIRRRR